MISLLRCYFFFFLFLGFCNSVFLVCAFVFRVSCDFSSTVPFLRLCFATTAAFLLWFCVPPRIDVVFRVDFS